MILLEKMECIVLKVGFECFVRIYIDLFIKLLFCRGIDMGIVLLVMKME